MKHASAVTLQPKTTVHVCSHGCVEGWEGQIYCPAGSTPSSGNPYSCSDSEIWYQIQLVADVQALQLMKLRQPSCWKTGSPFISFWKALLPTPKMRKVVSLPVTVWMNIHCNCTPACKTLCCSCRKGGPCTTVCLWTMSTSGMWQSPEQVSSRGAWRWWWIKTTISVTCIGFNTKTTFLGWIVTNFEILILRKQRYIYLLEVMFTVMLLMHRGTRISWGKKSMYFEGKKINVFRVKKENNIFLGGHLGFWAWSRGESAWIRPFLNSAPKNTPRCKISHFLPESQHLFHIGYYNESV